MAQIIIDKQNGELAFRLEEFNDLSQFDHLQRRNYYSIVLLNGISYELSVDFQSFKLQENQMVCLAPYQPFMFSSKEKCYGHLLNFHPDFFCTYRHQNEIETEGLLFNNFHGLPYFTVSDQSLFINLIDQISQEMDKDSIAQHEVLVAFLKVFLIEAVRQKKQFDKEIVLRTSDFKSETLQNLVDAIESNYCKLHSPQEYADKLCVSSKTLAGIVKKYLNLTPSSLISNRIIIEAKRELYLTSKPIKQIAAYLGYDDEFYFSRFFKKKVGVSPDIYRKTVGFAKLESE
ncbi:helix-turn-helix domain-containing protein [Flagellimonas allohymeniacidonis]|uniref:Helix-turn-helix domain-containing protein n=1 Tax=Flagellimonas allohymeniacidonis TaxID=2517819 RepID=A0A4Q8QDD9_9FLAO|nr:helix-turn-helix domain-containing protein [Allomuricauda hymeniacidonis]TAI48391.1 helix-turn-helix domain-containing protein [Allomuricauda hymeniacidonis]